MGFHVVGVDIASPVLFLAVANGGPRAYQRGGAEEDGIGSAGKLVSTIRGSACINRKQRNGLSYIKKLLEWRKETGRLALCSAPSPWLLYCESFNVLGSRIYSTEMAEKLFRCAFQGKQKCCNVLLLR